MNVLDAIFSRRSIRKYTGETISNELLETLLRAGQAAPSAHNYQPWHFVVVRDPEKLQQIAEKHPYAKMLPQAGCCIIVCGDEEKQPQKGFMIEDCAAAIQNILLAAHGSGLGAVWCGLHPVPQLTEMIGEVINLPSTIEPIGMVVVGHKAEEKGPAERFDQNKVHYDQW